MSQNTLLCLFLCLFFKHLAYYSPFFFPPTKLLFLCRQSSDDIMSLEIRKFTQWPLLSELNLRQRTNWTNLAIQPNVSTPTEIFVDVYWRHTNVLQNLPTKDLKKLWLDKPNETTRAPGLLPGNWCLETVLMSPREEWGCNPSLFWRET